MVEPELDEEGRPLRRVKRLKNLRVLECSLVDHPANPHSQVVLFKCGDGDEELSEGEQQEVETMVLKGMDQNELEVAMKLRCRQLEPALSYEQALLKHWPGDLELAALYRMTETASEPRRVEKSTRQAGDRTWDEVRAQAKRLRLQHPSMSEEQAISKVFDLEPGLYSQYLAEQQGV